MTEENHHGIMALDGAFNGWDKYWSLVEWHHESA
jgi:hypothetical protein